MDLARYRSITRRLLGFLHRWPMGFSVHQESYSLGDCLTCSARDELSLLHLCGHGDGGTLVDSHCILCDHSGFDLVDDAAVDGTSYRLEVLFKTWLVLTCGLSHSSSSWTLEDLELA